MISENMKITIDLLKGLPERGLVVYLDNKNMSCFIDAYSNVFRHIQSVVEHKIEFDEFIVLEKDIPMIYLNNFFLRYYYKHYHTLGYKILFPNLYLPKYQCVIKKKRYDDRYFVMLTGINNMKKFEILGITRDPIEAYELKKLWDECKCPVILNNINTRNVLTRREHQPSKEYDTRIIMGLDRAV